MVLSNLGMSEELIAEYLAEEICGKGVMWGEGYNFNQTLTHIRTSHYTECIHEIAHWIASDPSFRDKDNLDLPEDDPEEGSPLYKRVNEEEAVALAITKMLFFKYFALAHLSCQGAERCYIDYMDERCTFFCENFVLDETEIREKAKTLFETQTKNIPDPRAEYVFSNLRV